MVQKLSPEFAIWVDERIEELLKHGVTTISNDDEIIAQAMNVLQKRLEANQQQVKMLEGHNETLLLENEQSKKEIQELKPDAEYTQKVLNAPNTFTATSIAKELNIQSAQALNKELHARGVIFKNGDGIWVLYSKYAGKNYTKTRSKPIWSEKHQKYFDTVITVWTEIGRQFLHSLFEKQVA